METSALTQYMVQGKGNLVSDMNGEKVMLNIQTGKYYNLGSVGGRIWELIETPATAEEIINRLTSEYEVEFEQCKDQVIRFLQQLLNDGLIETGERSSIGA